MRRRRRDFIASPDGKQTGDNVSCIQRALETRLIRRRFDGDGACSGLAERTDPRLHSRAGKVDFLGLAASCDNICHATFFETERSLATRVKRKTNVVGDTAVDASRQPADVRQVNDIVSLVGRKVSGLRRAKGLSLQQLAAVSDVSPAAIHKIERSGMVPTITTLLKLATALGVSVSYFVQEDDSPREPVHFTPANQRQRIYTPHKGLSLAGITGSYRQFQAAAAVARMGVGANSGEKPLNHAGEELVHIISGEAVFRVNGQEYNLKAGDSLQFNGNVPHKWENRSKKPVDLIWVVLRND